MSESIFRNLVKTDSCPPRADAEVQPVAATSRGSAVRHPVPLLQPRAFYVHLDQTSPKNLHLILYTQHVEAHSTFRSRRDLEAGTAPGGGVGGAQPRRLARVQPSASCTAREVRPAPSWASGYVRAVVHG